MKAGGGESQGRLPDFVVIGAPKCGTTSLNFYLSLHPDIHMAYPKEPCFFLDGPEFPGRWAKGVEWYRGLFRTDKKICGEASAAYALFPSVQNVPERMAQVVPKAKLIYLVREPFARMESHFLTLHRRQADFANLADCLAAGFETRCVAASLYATQLERFLKFFPLKQILVLESDALLRNQSATLRRLFEFLDVDSTFDSPLMHHRRNVTRHQPIPNNAGRKILKSGPMRFMEKALPPSLFYHLRNIVLRPFAAEAPSLDLPESMRSFLTDKFHNEVDRLRAITGEKLPSLNKR
jgi:hypothetical protein